MREQKSTFILPDFRLCCNKSARLSSVARNRVLDCPENKARLLGATVSQRFVGAGFPRPRLIFAGFCDVVVQTGGETPPLQSFSGHVHEPEGDQLASANAVKMSF